ncbi:MAG: diguanylate cyclase [Methylibium sp.]|nr:diguanylate cyclase [Methylibium sp.]
MKADRHVPLAHVLDLLLDAVCIVDTQGRFTFVSAAFERIFGYAPEEVVGRPMIDLVFHEDRARTLLAVDEIVSGTHEPHFENRYVRKDGRIVHIMWSARWSPDDQVRVAVARDVTEKKRAESMQAALYAISEAAHCAQDLLALFEQIHQIIGRLLPAAGFFVALYDWNQDQLSFPYHVDDHLEAPAAQKLDSATLSAEVIRTGRTLHVKRDVATGAPERAEADFGPDALDWLGVPLRAQSGIIGTLVVKNYSADARYAERDIELLQYVCTQVAAAIERKQAQTRLQHIARHDPLTDLPNRELFQDRLQTALARAQRDDSQLALLYVDLDKFKHVNDSLGHTAGDLLLQEFARRLKQCVRESDTVARVGGDEFIVLLGGIRSPGDASLVAEKIRKTLGQPFELDGQRLSVAPSIGIALYPQDGVDSMQLIGQADMAMYRAKKDGGDRAQAAGRPGFPQALG